MKYRIEIIETYVKHVEVEANDSDEAYDIVKEAYDNGEIDDCKFDDVQFDVIEI
jgi:uncharacterized membrane protein